MTNTNFVKSIWKKFRQDGGVDGDAQRIGQLVWMIFLKVYDAKEAEWEYKAYKTKKSFRSIIPEEYRWRNWAPSTDEQGRAVGSVKTGSELLGFVNRLFDALKNLPITPNTPSRQAIVREVFLEVNQYQKDGVLLREVVNIVDSLDFTDAKDRHLFGDIYEGVLKMLQSAGNAGEFYTPRALTDFIVQRLDLQIDERFGDFSSGTGGFLTSTLNHLEKKVKTTADREKFQAAVLGQEWKPLPYLLSVTNLLLHGIDDPNIKHMDSLGKRLKDWAADCDVIGMNPPFGGATAASVKGNFPAEFQTSETADLFMALIMQRLKRGGRAGVIIPDGFMFGTEGAKLALKRKMLKEFNLHTVVRIPESVFAPYTPTATNVLFFDRPEATPQEGEWATKKTWFYRLDMPDGYKHFSKTKPMLLKHCDPVLEWWDKRKEIVNDEVGEKSRVFTVQQLLDLNCNFDQCKYPKEEIEVLPPDELIAKYRAERQKVDGEIESILAEIEGLLK